MHSSNSSPEYRVLTLDPQNSLVHYGEATGTTRSLEMLSKTKYLYLVAFVVDLKVYSFCQILKGRRVFWEIIHVFPNLIELSVLNVFPCQPPCPSILFLHPPLTCMRCFRSPHFALCLPRPMGGTNRRAKREVIVELGQSVYSPGSLSACLPEVCSTLLLKITNPVLQPYPYSNHFL